MGKVNTDTFQPSMLQASKILWNQHFKVYCGIFSSTKLMFTFSLFFLKTYTMHPLSFEMIRFFLSHRDLIFNPWR